MATPRELRSLAFQMLFQLDASPETTDEALAAVLADAAQELEIDLRASETERVMRLARGAFEARREADREIADLAPTWPAHRQPSVDRAILRLAHYEMSESPSKAKIVVNEAVEISKRFGTERSPAFVNGVLDKVLKRVLAASRTADSAAFTEPQTNPED